MSMSILVCDTSIPFALSLADALREKNMPVACASADDAAISPEATIFWNRSSVLSAKTVLLGAYNALASLDTAVMVFDTPVIVDSKLSAASSSAIIDECIKGYFLLAYEIASSFVTQKKGRIVFVLRPLSLNGKNIPVSIAEASFVALAEETTSLFASHELPALQTLLVRLETADDTENLAWLVEQMRQGQSTRNQVRWVKAGSKGLFGKL